MTLDYLPTFIWYLIIAPTYLNYVRSRAHSRPLISIFVFLVISGRIPFPILPNRLELWMIYGSIIAPVLIFASVLRWHRSYRSNFFNHATAPFFGMVMSVSMLCFGTFSFVTLRDYNPGYYLLLIVIQLFILSCLANSGNGRHSLATEICSAIFVSTCAICGLALFLQILIFSGLASCPDFTNYHPEGDIHCVPTPIGEIYRLSIGSNINEFSMYLLFSILLLLKNNFASQCQGAMDIQLPFSTRKTRFPLIEKKYMLLILFVCSFLALSRALMLGFFVFLILVLLEAVMKMACLRTSIAPSHKKSSYLTFSSIKSTLVVFLIISLFMSFLLSSEFAELFTSRFSFLWDFQAIFQGSSSQERINQFDEYHSAINTLSILPIISLGQGTILHNTLVQFLLEYGSLAAILGFIVFASAIFRAPLLVAPLLAYLLSHHVLYNPLLWLYLFAATFIHTKSPKSSF